MKAPLTTDKLRRSYDADNLKLKTTADIGGATKIIGQPRGVQAIEFGIRMKSPGYNIYVLGGSGTGRTTAIQQFVEEQAGNDPVPSDWLYVNNFAEPHKPLAIQLPAGEGCRLRDALRQLIRELRVEIARAFDNEAFRDAALEVRHELDGKRELVFVALQQHANTMDAVVASTAEGFRIVPGKDGQPLQPQDLAQLTEEQQAAWKETLHDLQHELNEAVHQARKLELEAQDSLEDLKRRVASSVVDVALEELKQTFSSFEKVSSYLEQLHQDILDHVDLFREEDEDGDENGEPGSPMPDEFRRYQVNVLVDHLHSEHAPVIAEYNPTVPNLLGRVEHEARYGGAVVTDFTLIRAGMLHAANGGYLVLRARDLFTEPGAWDALKRALVEAAVRPDDPVTRSGALARSLEPEAIPLDIKVILIGPPGLYYQLHAMDEDFQTIFKVMADFDETVPRTDENELDYARFIARRSHEEDLLHLERQAVGRVIEYGSRLAGTQDKLSTRFGNIADLVRESDYWARDAGRDVVSVDDVERAIDHGEYLRNRIETRMREHLMEGKQLVATGGAIVGQINGLAVSQIGDHAFGHPSRVTTRTYVGKQGVVQIDREVELAGRIHNKGVLTLIGYLGGQYAGDQPLSLSAQITFEQNYGGIEGDSASSTELYALLSSLSETPIKQSIAVTGSVNQLGEIQAIGGVTQKVEGWFNVCKERGLTGEQGVLIPASNVNDLMLRVAVVEAVAAGQFHIWAVETVDEGIEILTGVPAGKIHTATKARLKMLAEILEQYQASASGVNDITDLFCADVARESDESMAGTAPTVDAWFLLEYNGPWTAKATTDNDLPRSIQTWLTEELALVDNGRLQFIKRSRPALRAGITFFIALTQEIAPRLYEFRLTTYDDLQSLDLSAPLLGAAAYDRYLRTTPLYLVCTNGKRDRCCSRDGLALYQTLAEQVGDAAWQCTHLGGHRYAPTLVTFPDGAYYGRLTPSDLAPLVRAQTHDELLLSHLRGRCCFDDVVQAAEAFVRRETGLHSRDAHRLLDAQPIDENHWRVRFGESTGGEVHQLTISRTLSEDDRLVSCSPPKAKPIVMFRATSYETG